MIIIIISLNYFYTSDVLNKKKNDKKHEFIYILIFFGINWENIFHFKLEKC